MIIKEFFHNKTKKNTDYKFSSVFAHFFSDEGINVIKLLSLDYETIGSLVYKFKSGMAWLYKIEVEKKYQSDGFGHLLMSLFEEDCAKNRIKTIEGKFYPDNSHAKPFYLKRGYEIVKEYYDTYIFKTLNNSNHFEI